MVLVDDLSQLAALDHLLVHPHVDTRLKERWVSDSVFRYNFGDCGSPAAC